MNLFDTSIINIINSFSQISWTFDSTVTFISGNHLVKGGVLLVILWWGWFKANKNQGLIRASIISTLWACFIAMALGRTLALSLPFRFRPIHDENLNFLLPYTMDPGLLEKWSSFPSDHAALFYALSAGLFYISKKMGVFALIYTTLFIGLPRIYLGLHYPSDIVVGALLGIGVTLFCNTSFFVNRLSSPVLVWSNQKPELFYPVFFLISYQIADMFSSSRSMVGFLKSSIEAIIT